LKLPEKRWIGPDAGAAEAQLYVRGIAYSPDNDYELPAAASSFRESQLGVGITGMRERAEQMNGVFELESAPRHGYNGPHNSAALRRKAIGSSNHPRRSDIIAIPLLAGLKYGHRRAGMLGGAS